MEISKDLRLLAEGFEKKGFSLYIVGGFVRDSLLGHLPKDIDIASNMPYDEVIDTCRKLKFKAVPVNRTLGTIKIITKDEEYEYTRFRSESYNVDRHSPDEVIFIDDIITDCMRRDISINSMYYKIVDDIIVDPAHGQRDLTNHIIRTTNHPFITLNDDGLRILRVIRFASLLNFKIEKKTYKYLKLKKHKLNKISKERILQELNQIVVSDLTFGNTNNLFLTTFKKLDLHKHIFNDSFSRIKKFSRKDIANYYNLNKDSRLMGYYFLILKNYYSTYANLNQLAFTCNVLLGSDGIKESTSNIQTLQKIYLIYQNLEYLVDPINATINYLALSNAERDIIDNFLNSKPKELLSANIKVIKDNKLPLGIQDINIAPQDLIDAKIENIYIGKIMTTLFNQIIEMKVENKKEALLEHALNIHETFKKIAKAEGENNENNILPPRTKRRQSKNRKNTR